MLQNFENILKMFSCYLVGLNSSIVSPIESELNDLRSMHSFGELVGCIKLTDGQHALMRWACKLGKFHES